MTVIERQHKPSTWKRKVLMAMFIKLVKSHVTSHSFQWESSLFGPVKLLLLAIQINCEPGNGFIEKAKSLPPA